jgi:hypothetical protein
MGKHVGQGGLLTYLFRKGLGFPRTQPPHLLQSRALFPSSTSSPFHLQFEPATLPPPPLRFLPRGFLWPRAPLSAFVRCLCAPFSTPSTLPFDRLRALSSEVVSASGADFYAVVCTSLPSAAAFRPLLVPPAIFASKMAYVSAQVPLVFESSPLTYGKYMSKPIPKFYYDKIKEAGSLENAVDNFWNNTLPHYFTQDKFYGIEQVLRGIASEHSAQGLTSV